MSKHYGSEVHALWNCTECKWVKENVVEFPIGRDWVKWGLFEKDSKPQHRCRVKGKPQLRQLVWFEP